MKVASRKFLTEITTAVIVTVVVILLVSEFTSSLAAEEGLLSETGRKEFYVGAYLDDMHPQQYEGRYTGEFAVTVHFD